MIKEFQAFWELFQEGKELSNSKVWKDRQNAGNKVTAILFALLVIAKGFDFDIPVDKETVEATGFGIAAIIAVVNQVLTTITSAKVGRKVE